MTMLNPFTLFILILCTSFVIIQSRVPPQTDDANLIQQTCKKTPNYALCMQYLNADPSSANTDGYGLGIIMTNVLKTKSDIAINKIHKLIGGNPNGDEKVALNSCLDKYNAIVVADVPMAIEALKKGDPKFAEQGANDAALEVNSCETGFPGKSPMTSDNNLVREIANILSAIVKILLI